MKTAAKSSNKAKAVGPAGDGYAPLPRNDRSKTHGGGGRDDVLKGRERSRKNENQASLRS